MPLAHEEHGTGPAVVLLHGFPFDRTIWHAQARALQGHFRVILPDFAGFGASAHLTPDATIDDMADAVVALLDALHITDPVVLGGLSMGGYVALAAAVRHRARLRALMLIDTKAAADTPEAAANREKTAAAVVASRDVVPVVDGMIPRLFGPITRERHPEILAPVRALMLRSSPEAIAGALRAMAVRPDRTAILPALDLPTLVVVGEDDVISTPDEARDIVAALPNAQLTVIPRVGHMAVVEDSPAVNAALATFLHDLPTPRARPIRP